MTQVLAGMLIGFGIGSGGPKRQPVLVQFRLLPVSLEVRLASVRDVPLQQLTFVSDLPLSGTGVGNKATSDPPPPMYVLLQPSETIVPVSVT